MTLRTLTLALVCTVVLASRTSAQPPRFQVEGYPPYYHCGEPGTLQELTVVLYDANFTVSAVDFAIQYPPGMIWLADLPPDGYENGDHVVTIGQSPSGIAVAWPICCMQNAPTGLVVLRLLVLWNYNCDESCQYFVVQGYAPLGKTQPSIIRYPEFSEHPAIGMTTIFNTNRCFVPVEPTTWGKVKSLYR